MLNARSSVSPLRTGVTAPIPSDRVVLDNNPLICASKRKQLTGFNKAFQSEFVNSTKTLIALINYLNQHGMPPSQETYHTYT